MSERVTTRLAKQRQDAAKRQKAAAAAAAAAAMRKMDAADLNYHSSMGKNPFELNHQKYQAELRESEEQGGVWSNICRAVGLYDSCA